jgi:hypothetical protein
MDSTPPTEDELRRAKEMFESSAHGMVWSRILACQQKVEQADADRGIALRDWKDAKERGDHTAVAEAARRERRCHREFDAFIAQRAALLAEALTVVTEDGERQKMWAAIEAWNASAEQVEGQSEK